MIRFIHSADIHLGRPLKKIQKLSTDLFLALNQATEDSFKHLIDTAINEKVDFMLLAGDLYDSHDGNLQAQFLLKREMERLNQAKIPVILIFGNHDYQNNLTHQLVLPDNVKILGPEVESYQFETKQQETVVISGFSYSQPWIREGRLKEFPTRNPKADYHIGMMHAQLRTQQDNQDHYAPFDLSELKEKNYDYWALGHIHQAQVLNENPYIVYSGNIQGNSMKEQGAKGAYLVTLSPSQEAKLEFIETTDWRFYRKETKLPQIRTLDELRTAVEQALHEVIMTGREEALNFVLELSFTIQESDEETLYWWKNYHDALLNQLQWSLENQQSYHDQRVYLTNLSLNIQKEALTTQYSPFYQQKISEGLKKYEERLFFEEKLNGLMQNVKWARYIDPNIDREQFQKDVLEAVEELIALGQIEGE